MGCAWCRLPPAKLIPAQKKRRVRATATAIAHGLTDGYIDYFPANVPQCTLVARTRESAGAKESWKREIEKGGTCLETEGKERSGLSIVTPLLLC